MCLTKRPGGETPINNSITLYDSLQQRAPEFIKVVEEKVGEGMKGHGFVAHTKLVD